MVVGLLSVSYKDGAFKFKKYNKLGNIRLIKALLLPSICYMGWIACITFATHYNNIAHILVFSNAHIFVIAVAQIAQG